MPKIKYALSAEERRKLKIQEKTEKICKDIRVSIFGVRGKCNIGQNEMAEMTGFSPSTFSHRLKRPENFTFGELVKMVAAFPDIRESMIRAISEL